MVKKKKEVKKPLQECRVRFVVVLARPLVMPSHLWLVLWLPVAVSLRHVPARRLVVVSLLVTEPARHPLLSCRVPAPLAQQLLKAVSHRRVYAECLQKCLCQFVLVSKQVPYWVLTVLWTVLSVTLKGNLLPLCRLLLVL